MRYISANILLQDFAVKKICFILILSVTINCCSTIHAKTNDTVTVTFTGDVIMHGPVKSFAYRNNIIEPKTKKSINNGGFDILFEKVKTELTNSDYVIANMEFPIAPPFESKPMIFNCSPQVLDAFKNVNINIVNIANNHILDQGFEGVISTIKMLESKNIQYIGAGIYKKQDNQLNGIITGNTIKVGFIAYTGVLNYNLSVKHKNKIFINDFYNTEKVLKDIETIKKKTHFLVMIAHIGKEYSTKPSYQDKMLIQKYCNAGVDCVIGHHPHIIQPVEQLTTLDGRICTVFYSLGNFIANQSSTHLDIDTGVECSTREGLIVTLTLTKHNNMITPDYNVMPILIYNIPDVQLEHKYGRRIQPVPLNKMINDWGIANDHQAPYKFILRLKEIKKHLFYFGKYENIHYIEN